MRRYTRHHHTTTTNGGVIIHPRPLIATPHRTPYTVTPKSNEPTIRQQVARSNARRIAQAVLDHHNARALYVPTAPLPPRRISPHRQYGQMPPEHPTPPPATTRERFALWHDGSIVAYGTATHTRHEDGTHTLTRHGVTISVAPHIPVGLPPLRDVRCYTTTPHTTHNTTN